jgi:hypothetical protein|tara:strand:+ start:335 stop:709 length:375 start_codon:yes stop_codon:yes gene_type:complete
MANPNIVSVASIYGKTVYDQDIAASAASLVSNAASSGKIFKINSLIIANIDGTNSADISVTLRNAAGGTIYSYLAWTVAVPADATLIVISKDTSIYLEEDMSLYVQASAANDLSATCSYEEISE